VRCWARVVLIVIVLPSVRMGARKKAVHPDGLCQRRM
jgi:hypothetical protein